MINFITITLLCMLSGNLNYSSDTALTKSEIVPPDFLSVETYWVDSVMNTLSLEEKIAQLLMYPAYSNQGEEHVNQIKNLIKNHKIGGLIFMQGTPEEQVRLTNKYQDLSEIPLLIAMDAEWSLSMRLRNTVLYPRQMMLGAIQDNTIIYEMGAEFARQLRRVGAHINFAPVIDVNNNPANPVINDRSFGENKYNVETKSYYYMLGMQNNGIIATGKHFPGHGDTDVDSHYSLPVINHDRSRLDSIELYPFKKLINKGIGAIMTAHLFVPSIDSAHNMPTSLSPNAVNGILKGELGFKGLVFTDALNMGGITNHFKPGESDLLALKAGNDILLFPNDAEKVIGLIKNAVNTGEISENLIDYKCRKVLKSKYWLGLNETPVICPENLHNDLNNNQAGYIKQKLIENAITLVKNDNQIIPIKGLDSVRIAAISFGSKQNNMFHKKIKYYSKADYFIFDKDITTYGRKGLMDSLQSYDIVIASVHNTRRSPATKFGISQQTINFIDEIAKNTKLVLNLFANPYSLEHFSSINETEAIVISYNDWEITNDLSAQLLFGGIPALGRLPVSVGDYFEAGTGYDTEKIRLKYTSFVNEVGINPYKLKKVDEIITEGYIKKAYPGAVVMAARNGVVFYNKSIGNYTDRNSRKADEFAIYDLASLTKILSTTAAFMKLKDEELIDTDEYIANHLPFLDTTDKKNITYRKALAHQAGFISWIPFYLETIRNDSIFNILYSPIPTEHHSVKVADNMYMYNNYIDSIYNRILNSNLRNRNRFVYSDLGFYLIKDAIEKITGQGLNDYVENNFYASMGAWSLRYNPLLHFPKDDIVPTERDNIFRRQLIHGYVHDQGAAMMGGIGGHAGLFGNANDVVKFMQMLLDEGTYGGKQYINDETIKYFTAYNDKDFSRRGLGFDKANPKDPENGIGSGYASEYAFGHLGFTGTMSWADPENDLVVVFLSNRVYPSSENRRLANMKIRGEVLKHIYKAIEEEKEKSIDALSNINKECDYDSVITNTSKN